MGEIEIKPIAILISFIIWLDIDITVMRNIAKKKYKKKSEKFIEKAHAHNNYVLAEAIDRKYYKPWESDNGHYHPEKYKVTYEYIVNGKKYKKNIYYGNTDYPWKLIIYYSGRNPRIAIAENEEKKGIIYTLLQCIAPLSIFFGIPIFSILISKIISLF